MKTLQGIILKGIGGFYYVETADAVYECKAKGKFRKQGISPFAGDKVEITVGEDGKGTVDEIFARKNCLMRPPVSNIDRLAIVTSSCRPNPNTLMIDQLCAMAEKRGIEPLIIFTKSDLADTVALAEIYRKAGFDTFRFGYGCGDDIKPLLSMLKGKLTALCGNTGVGKSSLCNRLCPDLCLPTAEISEKLGRGKHTTRQAELINIGGGYLVDTAGFSTVNFLSGEAFLASELENYFRDFAPYLGKCRFTGCAHVADSGCAVCQAVKDGKISFSRHESYINMYHEIRDLKQWQINRNAP